MFIALKNCYDSCYAPAHFKSILLRHGEVNNIKTMLI